MADGFGAKMNEVNLDWIKGNTTPPPTSVWIALYSADPGDAGDADEIAVGDYARQEYDVADWSAIADEDGGKRITNDAAITFPDPTADYTVTHFAVMSASTAGDCYYVGELDEAIDVIDGEAPIVWPVGTLKLGSGT